MTDDDTERELLANIADYRLPPVRPLASPLGGRRDLEDSAQM